MPSYIVLFSRTALPRSVRADGTNSYAYDNANRLTRLAHTTGGGSVTLGDYQFAVDAVGNRTTINHSYDGLYRVTGASATGTLTNTFGYSYDAVGNRLTQNANGTLTSYLYDNANRLTSVNGQPLKSAIVPGYRVSRSRLQPSRAGNPVTLTLQPVPYNGVGDRLSQTVGIATMPIAGLPVSG